MDANKDQTSILGNAKPSQAIVKLALPATLALLAKAVYNIVDAAYIGMLGSDIALTAVGVTVPLLLIMVSIENIFAARAAVLAGRQLGAKDEEGPAAPSPLLSACPLSSARCCVWAASCSSNRCDASLSLAEDYAFWMFVAALANLPAQSMNCAARAESSVKISSIAVITGALLNVVLDPIFMFDWGLGMGVEGASYAFGAKQEERVHQSVRFALKGSLILTVLVAAAYILLSRPLILLFNQNPVIVDYGRWLLISQVALYPAFGLCYMMTITYQTIGTSGYGLFLSMIRQGLFYVPFILVLPRLLGVTGIYLTQPAADLLTILVCLCSIRSMKQIASANMNRLPEGD